MRLEVHTALVAALVLLAAAGGDPPVAAGEMPGEPLSLSGPLLPVGGLFSTTTGQYGQRRHRVNLDTSVGLFFPIETGGESFDIGGSFDIKLQGELFPYFFLGGEFAYAGHYKSDGEILSRGVIDRYYFLVPLEADIPLGGPSGNPISLRFGVAPGLQWAIPYVDYTSRYYPPWSGTDIRESDIFAFNLRTRIGLRIPMNRNTGALVELTYDWAEGDGKSEYRDLFGRWVQNTGKVDLSGVSLLFGFQLVF